MQDVIDEVKRIADKHDLRFSNDHGVIKLYSSDVDAIKRALSGLNDIMELAYTTAEHHPYWGALYNAIEIVRVLLENWEEQMDEEQMDELLWRVEEVRGILSRLKQDHTTQ